jgi:hypothetical protein
MTEALDAIAMNVALRCLLPSRRLFANERENVWKLDRFVGLRTEA